MGDAPSTAMATDAAKQLFSAYHHCKGKGPLTNMRFIEIEGENLENEIFQLCCWVSQTPPFQPISMRIYNHVEDLKIMMNQHTLLW